MAIGTLAAVGLGLAGVGSIVGSSSASKAAKTAAQTAQQTTDSNNALAAQIYGQNRDLLNPYVQRGNAAGNQINALLGLGGGAPNAAGATTLPAQAVEGPAFFGGGYEARDPLYYSGQDMMTLSNGAAYGIGTPPPAQTRTAQQAANDAFDIFRKSTGYQFRVNEGQNALNSGYAGSGLLQSGAALRELDDYRQNMASNELGNYMAYLGNQQGVGLSGASAVAGVGQNYANSVMQNNNNAGSAAANAALARGANNPFANALGMIGGGLFGMR